MSTPAHLEISGSQPACAIPLCVDLDGTLIRTDILWESILLLLRLNPLYVFLLPVWLATGRASLKRRVSSRVQIDAVSLPYHEELLAFLREQHRAGRPLLLATASYRDAAEPIAKHLGIFSGVVATSGSRNLKGDEKRSLLVGAYGARGFDYAGNSAADIAVWKDCNRAIVVNASDGLCRKASAISTLEKVFPRQSGWKTLPKALRVHQWVKNVLVLLPMLTSHQIFRPRLLIGAFLAFVAFSLCASSVYVLNDLFDLKSDRQHPTKRNRPFAAGNLSIPTGLILVVVLAAGSVAVSLFLPRLFQLVLAVYYGLTLAYSISLKQKLLVDVFVLGGLYVLRVLAGGAATSITPSPWLLAFCLFFFLSLALVKRFTELRGLPENKSAPVAGRGYIAMDLPTIGAIGTGSGCMCVLVLALYINSPQVVPLYRSPSILWFLCPLLLYWISRVWVMASRGSMNVDPVLFALRDRVSYLTALCGALIMMLAARGAGF
jgi:4-hydroxybenzoate polyprenyltransferase/phosphoserine phosphatase